MCAHDNWSKPQTPFCPLSRSGFFPRTLNNMARGILTIASRKRLESRKRLTPFKRNSRVINQFKPNYWVTFCQWAYKQKKHKLLTYKEGESPQTSTYLHFNYHAHARHDRGEFNKTDVYLALVELLVAIGESEGLVHNKMVFYRYISSSEHSNLNVHYKALKRQLQSMLEEYRRGEK